MRMLVRKLAVILAAAVVVAGIVMFARMRELRSQLAAHAVQVERIENRVASLQAGTAALERAAREGRQAAQTWSNRLVQVQAQLAEERSTHEPLRQQIERMMQQEIVYKSQIEKKESAIRSNDEGVSNLKHDLESARSMATAHAERIAQLEAEAKSRTENLAASRRALDEAKQATAAAKTESKELRVRLTAVEAQVAELKRGAAAPGASVVTNAVAVPTAN